MDGSYVGEQGRTLRDRVNAAREGSDVNVKAYDVNAKGDVEWTALMLASKEGHSEIVSMLLERERM